MQIDNMTKVTGKYADFATNGKMTNQNNKVDKEFQQMLGNGVATEVDVEDVGEGETKERMFSMIDDIDELKKKLEEQLTLKNLHEYKENVRQFINYYSENELNVEQKTVQDGRTYANKKYTVIEAINEKVDSMTDDLMQTNRGHLELLSKMGEINGLIINLII